MVFKEIKDKASYLEHRYPFYEVPKLTDQKHCIHCGKNFVVGDYKVELSHGEEFIVCPNAPKCDGTLLDWVKAK